MKNITKLLFFLLLLAACRNTDNTSSNAELFENYYQKNVETCVQVMLKSNVDSVLAVEKCKCMLNVLYEIDSTFVRKNSNELNAFIQENTNKIDSLFK